MSHAYFQKIEIATAYNTEIIHVMLFVLVILIEISHSNCQSSTSKTHFAAEPYFHECSSQFARSLISMILSLVLSYDMFASDYLALILGTQTCSHFKVQI